MKKKDDMSGWKSSELVLPSEEDKVWTKYRHTFIAEVNKKLGEEFREWRIKSDVAKLKDKKGGGVTNNDLIKAAQDLPQYQQQIRHFKVNIDLAQAATKQFSAQNLSDVVLLEQDIACWIDTNGKKLDREKLGARCSKEIFLSEEPKSNELKLRLFMIYLIAQGGLSELTRRTLMEDARFTDKEQRTIMSLGQLNVVLSSAKPPKEGHKNSEYWSAVQKAAQKTTKSKKEEIEEDEYPIRFLSFLEWAITNHIENSEGRIAEHFPYGMKKPGDQTKKIKPISWRGAKKPEKHPPLIVYVLGGVTYSELCTCYQLSEKYSIDIFIGSTAILSPQKYIQLLSQK